jgi:hypothetical protein
MIDVDGSNSITLKEFETFFEAGEMNPQMKLQLEKLSWAKAIFKELYGKLISKQ